MNQAFVADVLGSRNGRKDVELITHAAPAGSICACQGRAFIHGFARSVSVKQKLRG